MRRRYGERADEIFAAYQEEVGESPRTAQQAIQADFGFGLGTRTWVRAAAAGGSPTYLYFFTQAPPVFLLYLPDRPPIEVAAGPRGYGAYHSGDLPYAFANLHLVGHGWNDEDRELSRVMSQYWVNFAHHGDPNAEGLPPWPRYQADTDQAIELGSIIQEVSEVRKVKLDLFESGS